MDQYLEQAYELAFQNTALECKRLARALALTERTRRDDFSIGYLVPCSLDTDPSGQVLITARPGYIGPCHCKDREQAGVLIRAWCKHRLCVALLEKAAILECEAQSLILARAKRAEVNLVLYGEMDS